MKAPRVGEEIPALTMLPTSRTLVKFAAAAQDFYEIHYDDSFARSVGLPGVIVHGSLKGAYLAQLVTRWLGSAGHLQMLEVTYRGIDRPGRPYRCRGRVSAIEGSKVELDLWGEDSEGLATTTGRAVVELL
jgi:acyl dehydratase